METQRIGNTDVRVTEISFGCAGIGNLYREITDQQATEVLELAWRAGIRYFDTAPHYGRGRSESRLGKYLKDKPRESYVLSSKVGRVLSQGRPLDEADCYIKPLANDVRCDYSGDGIEAALEGSFARLGVTSLDIAYVHDIGGYTHGEANAQHLEAFFSSGYERLIKLKEKGVIRAFGLGVNENQVCLDILKHGSLDVILLAGRLSLLDRSAEEALTKVCQASNTSLVIGGVFNSGILATGAIEGATYDYGLASEQILERVRKLETRAQELGMKLPTAALHFVKRHASCASLLIGTAKASSLQRNLTAMQENAPKGFDTAFRI